MKQRVVYCSAGLLGVAAVGGILLARKHGPEGEKSPSLLCRANGVAQAAGLSRMSGLPATPFPDLAVARASRAMTAEAITQRRVFGEPIFPVGPEPSSEENLALSRALDDYLAQGNSFDFRSMERFLQTYPLSAWRASLRMNMGIAYRAEGRLGKAVEAWREAWRLSKAATNYPGRCVAEKSAGELADLWARLGRTAELAELLDEVGTRPIPGSAGTKVSEARCQMLSRNAKKPAAGCGATALMHLAESLGDSSQLMPRLPGMLQGPDGVSLNQVLAWGKAAGMALFGVRLDRESTVPVPSLFHWKLGHFAAIVAENEGRYLVKNYVPGEDCWLSRKTLLEEAGYVALIPQNLEKGPWKMASSQDLSVMGASAPHGPGPNGPGGNSGDDGDNPDDSDDDSDDDRCEGMPVATLTAYQAGLRISDAPLWYTPAYGPAVRCELTYNQYDTDQPTTFTYSNFGPKWTFSWMSYIEDFPSNPTQAVKRYKPKSGMAIYAYKSGSYGTAVFNPNYYLNDQLSRPSEARYERKSKDGSLEIYDHVDGSTTPRRVFLTKRVDPAGNAISFIYQGNRMVSVIDAQGRATNFLYELPGDSLKITKIVAPDGRTATFTYKQCANSYLGSHYQLESITDMIGLTSRFEYLPYAPASTLAPVSLTQSRVERLKREQMETDQLLSESQMPCGKPIPKSLRARSIKGKEAEAAYATVLADVPADPGLVDFISAMITPYGTTQFAAGHIGSSVDRWVEATDPLGFKKRMEYRYVTYGVGSLDITAPAGLSATYLGYSNSFYWNKRAMEAGPGDITKAKIYNWLDSRQNIGYASPLARCIKKPMENRVWYDYGGGYYEGQFSKPQAVVRLLEDGTESRFSFKYNSFGKVTEKTDPVGRITKYVYSDNGEGADLLEVRNVTGGQDLLLAKFRYNTQHKPEEITDTAGQKTAFTYKATGQVETVTTPRNTTTFTYDPPTGGWLQKISVGGAETRFSYDGFKRINGIFDPDGNETTALYDELDRAKEIHFTDGSSILREYDKLDLVKQTDRLGRVTLMRYTPLRQLFEVSDPLGTTRFDWCTCGALEQLTDSLQHTTNWWRDLQGRVMTKRLDDGKMTHDNYDYAGRLVQRTDAKGRLTTYAYYPDGALKQVDYPSLPKTTPSVSYVYDTQFPRLASIQDGLGTLRYAYHPITTPPALGAGRLKSVSGPLPDSEIQYTYDELGRVKDRIFKNATETRTFDALGRLEKVNNPLGEFKYGYDGLASRLKTMTLPNGQTTAFDYYDKTKNFYLQAITNSATGGTVSAFQYDYNADGTIKTWKQKAGAADFNEYTFGYDDGNRLIGAVLKEAGVTRHFGYGYDAAGNRTAEILDDTITTSDHNQTNQLILQRHSPTLRNRGKAKAPETPR